MPTWLTVAAAARREPRHGGQLLDAPGRATAPWTGEPAASSMPPGATRMRRRPLVRASGQRCSSPALAQAGSVGRLAIAQQLRDGGAVGATPPPRADHPGGALHPPQVIVDPASAPKPRTGWVS